MNTWTGAAREALDHYFGQVRQALITSGADPAEVIEDMRRHVENEAAEAQLEVVTEADVRRMLARIGPPEPAILPANGKHSVRVPESDSDLPPAHPQKRPSLWLLIFGFAVPAAAVLIELVTGICAAAFFDPIPTWAHGLLVLSVPTINLLVWLAVRNNRLDWRRWLCWANAFGIGISTFYAFLFLPMLLAGLIAVVFFGIGLLPWAPVLALIGSVRLRWYLRKLEGRSQRVRLPGLFGGLALAALALVTVEAPIWVTRISLGMAASDEPGNQRQALRWLRTIGHQETLLRACYGRSRGAEQMDIVGTILGGESVHPEKAREIYYRVTGRAFNSVSAPNVRTGRGRWAALDEWTWDADQGGTTVGGRLKGLALRTSRLDAAVDGDAGLAYVEWVLEFGNDAAVQREARMQIQLPPGGVVSRLTLWVNGEEREAAFGGRGEVREAYQKVAIQQRRDPVLVTTSGPDRVLVQCFPVSPNGGLMKVRLGVTAPLTPDTVGEGWLRLPHFVERNFSIPRGLSHAVWVESKTRVRRAPNGLKPDQSKPNSLAYRGQLTEQELSTVPAVVQVDRNARIQMVWAQDVRDSETGKIRQMLEQATQQAPSRVVVVIDGSRIVFDSLGEIADGLSSFPENLPLDVLVASEDVVTMLSEGTPDPAVRRKAILQLRTWPGAGGCDNVPALVRAWDVAAQSPNAAIVWIHGPEPILIQGVGTLRQAWERRPAGPVLLELQTEPGPDRVLEALDGLAAVQSIPRFGSITEDLKRLSAVWAGTRMDWHWRRERKGSLATDSTNGAYETSFQLVRLWAKDEILRLCGLKEVTRALAVAARYQLVTPISGAVVLETQAQYQAANLEPVAPTNVPAIPEPSSLALMVLGVVILARFARRRGHRSFFLN